MWDVVSEEKDFIEGGFPIATFFVDVAPDAYCVDDMACRYLVTRLEGFLIEWSMKLLRSDVFSLDLAQIDLLILKQFILYLRSKLKQLKKQAWDKNQEKDVLCNFYVASTGVVYEGRGWGIKVILPDSLFATTRPFR